MVAAAGYTDLDLAIRVHRVMSYVALVQQAVATVMVATIVVTKHNTSDAA
jgi:hypothetical protein